MYLYCRFQSFFLVTLWEQFLLKERIPLYEVRIVWLYTSVTYQLWYVNAISWGWIDVTAEKWEVDIWKVDIITFVIDSGLTWSIRVIIKFECLAYITFIIKTEIQSNNFTKLFLYVTNIFWEYIANIFLQSINMRRIEVLHSMNMSGLTGFNNRISVL